MNVESKTHTRDSEAAGLGTRSLHVEVGGSHGMLQETPR